MLNHHHYLIYFILAYHFDFDQCLLQSHVRYYLNLSSNIRYLHYYLHLNFMISFLISPMIQNRYQVIYFHYYYYFHYFLQYSMIIRFHILLNLIFSAAGIIYCLLRFNLLHYRYSKIYKGLIFRHFIIYKKNKIIKGKKF